MTLPDRTADPKKVEKIDFDFSQFFLHFCVGLVTVIISTQYMPIRTQLLRKCEHFYGNRPLARSALMEVTYI